MIIEMTSPPERLQMNPSTQFTDYRNATHHIISIMAYLIGVEQRHFENEHEPPKLETFLKLNQNKNARIIRHLCMIRTALEKHYSAIRTAFYYDLKNLSTLPEYISTDAVRQLSADGISLQKTRPDVDTYLIAINREIANRINNIRNLFPDWINWEYIRPIFIMPNGFKTEGLKAAGMEYNADRNRYPYQCYINWSGSNNGNILHNDEKFVTLLYECHEDYFEDKSLVKDAGNITLDNIYSFIDTSERCVIVVDCENSDPIKLAAALSSLSNAMINKVIKVLLFDSDYTTSSWKILSKIETLPIEHIRVPRLNQHKSQVDMTLAATTCKEVYTNAVDSIILVSSDSDYWALIQTLSDIDFLVMVEKRKCGKEIKNALDSCGIHYCYIDDFCTGASYTIKTTALLEEIQQELTERVQINVKEMMDSCLKSTWIQMSDREQERFYEKYVKGIHLKIDSDGNLKLLIG